jgi:hypothetical protein
MRLRIFHRSMLGVVGVAALLWVAFGYFFNRMMALKATSNNPLLMV